MTHRRCTRTVAALAVAVVALLGSADASANSRTAKKHFKKAEIHYRAGRFASALDEYTKAYKAKSIPALLFNISQCHMELRQWDRAVFFYENYLRDDPETANRELVQDRIAEARRNLDREKKGSPNKTNKKQPAGTATPGARTRAPPRGRSGGQEELAGTSAAGEGGPPIGAGSQASTPEIDDGRDAPPRSDVGKEPGKSDGQDRRNSGEDLPRGDGAGLDLDAEVAAARVAQPDPMQSPDLDVNQSVDTAPFYAKWWFWGVVGVVVASAAATAYYFIAVRDQDNAPCGGMPADWCVDLRAATPQGAAP